MSASSGQLLTETVESMYCDVCGFDGLVDVWRDPELMAAGWTCPNGHDHDLELVPDDRGFILTGTLWLIAAALLFAVVIQYLGHLPC